METTRVSSALKQVIRTGDERTKASAGPEIYQRLLIGSPHINDLTADEKFFPNEQSPGHPKGSQ